MIEEEGGHGSGKREYSKDRDLHHVRGECVVIKSVLPKANAFGKARV